VDTYEELVELRRLSESPFFIHVNKLYQREVNRLEKRLMARDITDVEALRIRAALVEMTRTTPVLLLEQAIGACDTQVAKAAKAQGYPPSSIKVEA